MMALTVANRRSEIQRLSRLVDAYAETHAIPESVVFNFQLSLDEIVTNIILHGYDDDREHQIVVRLTLEDSVLSAEVEDDGRPFNPLEAPPADVEAVVDNRPIGGLGLHIVRSMMDSLEYRRENGRNILTLRKAVR